jgi:ribosomal protein S18 acetylase RimI-like enzyme
LVDLKFTLTDALYVYFARQGGRRSVPLTPLQKGRPVRPHSFELLPPRSSQDWDRYHDIRRRCLFEKYHGKGTQYYCEYDADYPDEWTPGHQPLVFLRGREVTGTIRIDFKPAGRAVFRLIAIDTPRQGQGLGNIMLEMAEDYVCARGVDSICLNSVADAYGFYVRHGFRRWRWEGCTSNRTEIPMMKLLPLTGSTTLSQYPSLQQSALARHWSEPVC